MIKSDPSAYETKEFQLVMLRSGLPEESLERNFVRGQSIWSVLVKYPLMVALVILMGSLSVPTRMS